MSTNFWWTPKYGEPEAPILHIGKQFGAGRDEDGRGTLAYCFEAVESPDGPPIDSWAAWRAVIRTGGQVYGDNGAGLIDTEEFITKVEACTPENRRKQFDMTRGGWRSETDFLDADGFSFTWEAFS